MNKSLYTHPKRKKSMKRPEQAMQIGVFNFLRRLMEHYKFEKFIAFHVSNGGYRTKAEASIFKKMGVMAGVADIILLIEPNDVHQYPTTVFVEMKAKGGRVEKTQRQFGERVSAMGFRYYILEASDPQDALNKFIGIMEINGVNVK